jgi:hypothetical protein
VSSEAAPETFEQYIRRLQALYPAHAMAILDHAVRMFADSYRPSDVEAIASLLRWARKFETAAPPPAAPTSRRVVVELPSGWQPPAVEEPDPEEENTPPPRQPAGMAPEVRRAMSTLVYRLHEWAEGRADRDGTFTCVRSEAAEALRVSPRRVGYAMRTHLDAGAWAIQRKGRWGKSDRLRRRPSRTLYRLVDRFDRAKAMAVYQRAKAETVERIEKARKRDTGPHTSQHGAS